MKFKKLAALSIVLSLCSGAAVHAEALLPFGNKENTSEKNVEYKHKHHMRKGHSGIYEAAKHMGISENDLKEAKKNGKNFFELAKKKGYSEKEARDFIIKTKREIVLKAVSEGKITKEKGDEIIKNSEDKISKWDGTLKSHKGQKNSQIHKSTA